MNAFIPYLIPPIHLNSPLAKQRVNLIENKG